MFVILFEIEVFFHLIGTNAFHMNEGKVNCCGLAKMSEPQI